ncbi:hypothetical protein PCANB_001774 [Pneumocystis canis]|nr:hypothetical protein PCK1_002214 [Pneumocystis canis]KAG5440205.1 hypothetical protein PCANB_001774 [Pneumocystis canis]
MSSEDYYKNKKNAYPEQNYYSQPPQYPQQSYCPYGPNNPYMYPPPGVHGPQYAGYYSQQQPVYVQQQSTSNKAKTGCLACLAACCACCILEECLC